MWMAYMGVITTHYPLITHSNAVLSTSGVPSLLHLEQRIVKEKKMLSIMGQNYFL